MPPKRTEPSTGLRFRTALELRALLKASLRDLMEKRSFTYELLAERARVNKRHLEQIGSGEALGSIVTLHKLSTALRVPLDDLFKAPTATNAASRAHDVANAYKVRSGRRPAREAQLETLLLEARNLDSETVDMLIKLARKTT